MLIHILTSSQTSKETCFWITWQFSSCSSKWIFPYCYKPPVILYVGFDFEEQDKSSDIEQQPPFGDCKISNIQPQNRAGVQNQQEHHIILTKYEAVHPTAVSENYSSSGMLMI